jgi:hypothetical protein
MPETGKNLPKNYLFVIEGERKNGELRGEIKRIIVTIVDFIIIDI